MIERCQTKALSFISSRKSPTTLARITSWAELASDACKLTDRSKKIYGASLSNEPARWLAAAYAYGANLFNKGLTQATIDSPAAARSLDLYAGLVKKGCAARPDQVGTQWNGESYGKQFTAMAVMRFHSDGRALVYDGLPGPIPARALAASFSR